MEDIVLRIGRSLVRVLAIDIFPVSTLYYNTLAMSFQSPAMVNPSVSSRWRFRRSVSDSTDNPRI